MPKRRRSKADTLVDQIFRSLGVWRALTQAQKKGVIARLEHEVRELQEEEFYLTTQWERRARAADFAVIEALLSYFREASLKRYKFSWFRPFT